jgi:hypothetical protein
MGKFDANTTSLILLAVWFWDKDEVSAEEVLHAASEIDRALSKDELEVAVGFLVEYGLIRAHGGHFRLTDLGRSTVESASSGVGNVIEQWHSLERSVASLAAA